MLRSILRIDPAAILRASAALLAVAASTFQTTTAQSAPSDDAFVVECGVLVTGDGSRLEGGALVVRDGRIASVLAKGEARPADLRRVDCSDKFVMPGLVAADTDLAAIEDDIYQVTPDFVALDGFDFLYPRDRLLSGGITTTYLSPGRDRLIPGQGSVVKLYGDDVVERVLRDEACLRVTLDERSLQSPDVFEPVVAPTADDPLLPPRRQVPSARISQLWRLRQVFEEAQREASAELLGEGTRENLYDPTALRRVVARELPLRIAAREAGDIRRALAFAREIGADLVLEDPWQLAPVARDVARADAPVVLRLPIRLGSPNPGGEDLRQLDEPTRSFDAPALAERAGIPFALAPASDEDLADLLLVAGFAIRAGTSPDAALRSITIDAARAVGVADRVGSLTVGKDADFLVLSGEPFGVGTLVEQTWVDGEKAYERKVRTDALIVRADTVLTGNGQNVTGGGAVLAKGRKINAVGAGLSAPFGATEIVLPEGSVILPGFVNARTSAGLSGEGTGIPGGSPDQRIADVADPADPVLREIARAGVTTVLVSGAGNSGRITALKTAAETHDELVLEEIAGVRVVYDAIGDGAIGALSGQFDAAQKYLDSWQEYEKALAAWQAEKDKPDAGEKKKAVVEEPKEEAETAEAEASEDTDPISGKWEFEGSVERPFQLEIQMEIELKLADDGAVSGSGELTLRIGPREITREIELASTSKFENGTLTLELDGGGGPGASFSGKVENDKVSGTAQFGPAEGEFSGERVEKGEGGGKSTSKRKKRDDDGRPKPPKVQEGLEPMRAVLEGRAAVVVESRRAPAIEAVLALLREKKVPYLLAGIDDALDTPEILGDEPPAVLLGPDLVRYEKGEIVNAPALLADRDVPLAIGTDDTLGARYLPLQVAHAIRYGLDPEAALRAVTADVARAFKLDDRIGTLERGKDADFIAFSGSPFEPTSRLLLVVIDGRVVVDNREETDR
jgi:imidazolonepropionase-like amidohydrolase